MFAYMRAVRRYAKHDDGASAVEYGLLVAAIAAVIVFLVFAIGRLVQQKFTATCNSIDTNGKNQDGTTATVNCKP